MLLQVLILILAIVILYFGAEFALNAAERIGKAFKFSPLVIGLVIVGFGTSLPEFFVSHLASYRGEYGLALGNIMGSNVANMFLILGVAGLMTPLLMARRDILLQLVWHMALTFMLGGLLMLDALNWASFVLMEAFFLTYLAWTYLQMRKDQRLNPIEDDEDTEGSLNIMVVLRLLLGFLLLYGGGELLVSSGTALGQLLGVPPFVISAVFVAFGTSFPELVTALVACIKKKDTDLITGNILGSNIFNVALILGSLSVYKLPLEESYQWEVVGLFAGTLIMLVLGLTGLRLYRVFGALFLAAYGAMIFHWVG